MQESQICLLQHVLQTINRHKKIASNFQLDASWLLSAHSVKGLQSLQVLIKSLLTSPYPALQNRLQFKYCVGAVTSIAPISLKRRQGNILQAGQEIRWQQILSRLKADEFANIEYFSGELWIDLLTIVVLSGNLWAVRCSLGSHSSAWHTHSSSSLSLYTGNSSRPEPRAKGYY